MNIITISHARADIYRLVDTVNNNHEPAFIKGKTSNAILIGEEDWNSIKETLYLASIPGMMDSIIEGHNTKLEDCIPYSEELWSGK